MGAPPRSTIVRSVTDARYDVVGEPVELVWFVEGGPEDVAIQAQSTVPSGQRLRPVLPAATEAVPVGADGRDHVVDARNGGRVPTGSAAPWSMAARAAGRASGGRDVLSGDTHPSASWPMARNRRGLRAPTQIDTWWTERGPGSWPAVQLKRPSMRDRPAGSSAAHTIRMPSMLACRLSPGVRTGPPMAAIPSAKPPAPTAISTRPPVSTSKLAAALATIAGARSARSARLGMTEIRRGPSAGGG